MPKNTIPFTISYQNRHVFNTKPLSLRLGFIGDSIISGSDAAGTTTALQTYAKIVSAAQIKHGHGGAVLAEEIDANNAFWDFTNEEPSSEYVDNIQPLEGTESLTDVIIGLGTNDAVKTNGVTNNISKTDWKTAYKDFIAHIKAQFPSVNNIYIRPIGRHITRNDGFDEWNAVREAIYEVATETSGVYLMPEYYDLPIDNGDNVHPSDYTKMTERESTRIAHINGATSQAAECPKITRAEVTDTGIRASITHRDGNDITISGDPSSIFRGIAPDGDAVVIDSVVKVNANTLDLNFTPVTAGSTLVTLYGTMDPLADDGSDSIKDNSTLALPLGYSEVVPTDTDVIRAITNLEYEMRPSYAKTYDSGVDVLSVVSANGRSFDNLNVGNFFDFDATAFDGAGGFVSTGSNCVLNVDSGLPIQAGMFLGFVVELPSSFGFSGLFGMTDASTPPSGNNRIFVQSSSHGSFPGFVGYGTNESQAVEYISSWGNQTGNRLAIFLNYTSASNLDIYVNDATTPALTLNPRDSYTFQNSLSIGGADAGIIFGGCFAKVGTHDAVNDPSLTDIMNALKTDYGIS